MSDNNADYNGSGQDEYFATNDSIKPITAVAGCYNQPASQPHNPNPYASQQPVQGYAPGTQGNNIPGGTYGNGQPYVSRCLRFVRPRIWLGRSRLRAADSACATCTAHLRPADVRTYGLRTIGADPYYQEPTQPQYTQYAYNQPPTYAQQTYYQATQQQPGYGYAQKSKIVAGLLGLFLGTLGVHNFYLGYTGKAVAQLLLTLIGWIIFIGPIISGIWALIEAVLILCSSYGSNWHRDGHGQELQD